MDQVTNSRRIAFAGLAVLLMAWAAAVGAQGQIDVIKARRCAMLARTADYYLTRRGEGSGGPNMIVLSARLDCEKGAYDRGIGALEKLLSDKRIPVPRGP